ncbi:MAG: hypothetical protein JSS98_13540 [Bacteroidetes bacterium]|nr:hypothetical protein [Bacteroidota bacterium]
MKSKIVFAAVILVVINFSASAQKKKSRFHSINTFSLLNGESQFSTAFQSVNGIEIANGFAGIGLGIDYYQHRTIPLFLDGRWNFGSDKKGFIYGDVGYNFPMKNKPGNEVWRYDTYHFSGGIYTDIGIGYKATLSKKLSCPISIGYSYKKLQSKIGTTICPFVPPCYTDYNIYNYKYNRIVVKAGLEF